MQDDDIKDGIDLDNIKLDSCEICEKMFDEDELEYGLCKECYDEPEAEQIIFEAVCC